VTVTYAYIWENNYNNKFVMVCTYRPSHMTQQEAYPYHYKKYQVSPMSYCPSRKYINTGKVNG
tara:strand:- start:250 stop:438 length:189 start_codon:yes stop_codon:yes gene_type:complete